MVTVMEQTGELALLTWAAAETIQPAARLAEDAYRELDTALRAMGAAVLQERIFGSLSVAPQVLRAREHATGAGSEAWAVPPTFVEGAPVAGEGLAGIHVLAARATSSRLVTHAGQVMGRITEAPGVRLLGLADTGRVASTGLARDPAGEATAAIEGAEHLLAHEGFSFRDVARTWYHLCDIVAWYGRFNGARNAAFRRMGLIGPDGDGAVPASTGIGGKNVRGGWCALDLLAVRATGGQPLDMTRLHNRRQNEATTYGSAFARGMALTLGGHRYLFVSGTASIDDHGATVHVGDFDAQTSQTIEAIQSLLEGAGASLGDLRQAMVFLKDPADARRFERIAQRAGLTGIPPSLSSRTSVETICWWRSKRPRSSRSLHARPPGEAQVRRVLPGRGARHREWRGRKRGPADSRVSPVSALDSSPAHCRGSGPRRGPRGRRARRRHAARRARRARAVGPRRTGRSHPRPDDGLRQRGRPGRVLRWPARAVRWSPGQGRSLVRVGNGRGRLRGAQDHLRRGRPPSARLPVDHLYDHRDRRGTVGPDRLCRRQPGRAERGARRAQHQPLVVQDRRHGAATTHLQPLERHGPGHPARRADGLRRMVAPASAPGRPGARVAGGRERGRHGLPAVRRSAGTPRQAVARADHHGTGGVRRGGSDWRGRGRAARLGPPGTAAPHVHVAQSGHRRVLPRAGAAA